MKKLNTFAGNHNFVRIEKHIPGLGGKGALYECTFCKLKAIQYKKCPHILTYSKWISNDTIMFCKGISPKKKMKRTTTPKKNKRF